MSIPLQQVIRTTEIKSIQASGNVEYQATFEIKNVCKDPILITIFGNSGNTITQVLSDHRMTTGSLQANLIGDFVGDMFKVKLDKIPEFQFIDTKDIVKYSAI